MPFDCKKTHVIEKLKEEEKKIFFVKRNFSALLSSALNLTEVSVYRLPWNWREAF